MKIQDLHLLSKDERRTLFLRAASRGDNQEARAVVEASPRVEIKVIDFSHDLHALMGATLVHCLDHSNLVIRIIDLWEDQDDDMSFLSARIYATHLVVRDAAFRAICKEDGFDFDKLLTMWEDFMYVNYEPRFGWIKKLALRKSEYKVSTSQVLKISIPTVEEEIERYRKVIEEFRRVH